jgi:uncharacterized protein YbjT (DUF2867 family)
MHVLIIGATGFIGRHVCARLLRGGHVVTAAVRDTASAKHRFPEIGVVFVDLNRMSATTDWIALLKGVDVVVNCAGVLRSVRGQSAEAIHTTAPRALFNACVEVGVRKVVQISAISADAEAGTEFALTKKAADDHLRRLDLDWVLLRPSLVYAQGSYGGTSTIRGLAGLPGVIPLVSDGGQVFQPIHADDLAEAVARCVDDRALARCSLDPVGPEILSMRQIVERTRAWLDLPPAHFVRLPIALIRVAVRLGDMVNAGPISTIALDQMLYGNTSNAAVFESAIGFRPRTLGEAFRAAPSHVQDRWHARLYFLRPMLTVALCVLWLGSGLVGLYDLANARAAAISLGLPNSFASIAVIVFSLLDIAIGAALATGRGRSLLGPLQLAIVGFYTAVVGWVTPGAWTEIYGPLLKNIPILVAIAIWSALRNAK